MNDERASQGLDHLQAAALEMIHAARAFLDVAEEVVTDQDKVAGIVEVLGSVADAATRAARGEPLRPARGRSADRDELGDDDRDDGGVQHIPVA
jgi:hypothetical protein